MRSNRCSIRAATVVLAAIVAACGGGGDSPPPARTVEASNGDAGKYVGWWSGECATATVGDRTREVKIVVNVTAASGNRASGHLNTTDYGVAGLGCSNTTGLHTSSSTPITITVDSTAVAAAGIATGQADRVSIEADGSPPQIAYVAFEPGFRRFWLNSSPTFEESDVAYTK